MPWFLVTSILAPNQSSCLMSHEWKYTLSIACLIFAIAYNSILTG